MNKLTNKLKLQKGQSGFTIIEVLIVLAIGALIILAVLLAVPALQKNQRNSQRKAEASRVAAAATAFVADSNNTLPAASISTTTGSDAASLLSRAGLNTNNPKLTSLQVISGSTVPSPLITDRAYVFTNASCSGATVTTGKTSTSIAVVWPLDGETTAGACLDAQ